MNCTVCQCDFDLDKEGGISGVIGTFIPLSLCRLVTLACVICLNRRIVIVAKGIPMKLTEEQLYTTNIKCSLCAETKMAVAFKKQKRLYKGVTHWDATPRCLDCACKKERERLEARAGKPVDPDPNRARDIAMLKSKRRYVVFFECDECGRSWDTEQRCTCVRGYAVRQEREVFEV